MCCNLSIHDYAGTPHGVPYASVGKGEDAVSCLPQLSVGELSSWISKREEAFYVLSIPCCARDAYWWIMMQDWCVDSCVLTYTFDSIGLTQRVVTHQELVSNTCESPATQVYDGKVNESIIYIEKVVVKEFFFSSEDLVFLWSDRKKKKKKKKKHLKSFPTTPAFTVNISLSATELRVLFCYSEKERKRERERERERERPPKK